MKRNRINTYQEAQSDFLVYRIRVKHVTLNNLTQGEYFLRRLNVRVTQLSQGSQTSHIVVESYEDTVVLNIV